jgi:hypothetical protein
MSADGFISRWSRRKLASKVAPPAEPQRPAEEVIPAQAGNPSSGPTGEVIPAQDGSQSPQSLPPVESLTPESDFAPFMKPEVDADTKREAVKMLFQDPRYNVMDGLDIYIDDYSKPDPLPEGWLEKMTQMARLGEYRDPEKEAAAKKAPDEPSVSPDAAENVAGPLPSVESNPSAAAGSTDAQSPPAEMKESRPGR